MDTKGKILVMKNKVTIKTTYIYSKSITMKNRLLVAVFLQILVSVSIHSQTTSPLLSDESIADPENLYQSNDISKLDLIKAIEVLGIRIFKFSIPNTIEAKRISILVLEYEDGELIGTDTLRQHSNQYTYWKQGYSKPFKSIITKARIISELGNDAAKLHIDMHSQGLDVIQLPFKAKNNDASYNIRPFHSHSEFKMGSVVPLLIIASSWIDVDENFSKFCGLRILNEIKPLNPEKDEEYMIQDNSPHYYILAYVID